MNECITYGRLQMLVHVIDQNGPANASGAFISEVSPRPPTEVFCVTAV